jgi:hypothetical protein
MRRLLLPLALAGSAALTLSAPTIALANHGHRHHHKRHSHHAKVSFEHLGPPSVRSGSAPGAGSGPGATQPTTPTPPAENAGKVASYTGGVLTLTLSDGSSVSGKVTAATHIECVSATPPPVAGQGEDGSDGDDNGPSNDSQGSQGNGPPAATPGGPSVPAHAMDDQGGGDDRGDDPQGPASSEPPCDSSALVPGAIVRDAELRIGPGGAEFESIELVR